MGGCGAQKTNKHCRQGGTSESEKGKVMEVTRFGMLG
jgi:hypothetical protein